jgi:hypothetical protein
LNRQTPAEEETAAGGQETVPGQTVISPALAAAQQKLESLRLACRPHQTQRQSETTVQLGRIDSPQISQNHQSRPNDLPDHLGWNSEPLTKAYRLALKNQAEGRKGRELSTGDLLSRPQPTPLPQLAETAESEDTIKLSPDVALAILRHKLASPGRIWLLLRHLDNTGRGWIAAESARQQLAGKASKTAVCGKRQLRNLLAAGDNIFWERDQERIWLRSTANVAAVLGLTRLNGRPVSLPLSIFLEPIGTVRAHLFGTFHSSRNGRVEDETGKPISRKTLKELSSTTRRTQRLYEKHAGVRSRCNYAVVQSHTPEAEQNLAWQHGPAVFQFKDQKGFAGRCGRLYLARQLPNSYHGPHETLSKGHQRRANRQLADLLNKGITGNGKEEVGYPAAAEEGADCSGTAFRTTLFYCNGSKAAKAYNRSPRQDIYWRSRYRHRRFNLWHSIPANSEKERP